jgi:uncharacterized FlaG/YvyC family protein
MELSKVDSVATANAVNSATPSTDNVPPRQLVAAVHDVNKAELMGEGRQLTFGRDPQTRQRVIQIIDEDTGDVVDQIPPETVLELAAQLK